MLTAIRLITFALIACVTGMMPAHVSIVAAGTTNSQTQTLERRLHLDPVGSERSRYAYLPFEVPPQATRITISYQYDHANGANTIDIGLFDARSTGRDDDRRGFRGWSGGRRSEFYVSPSEATPGYTPGNLPAGTWRVILGLYRVAPRGVDVLFRIIIETDAQTSSATAPRSTHVPTPGASTISAYASCRLSQPPLTRPSKTASPPRWFRGDLHMHTVHSDGDWTVAELSNAARELGLDFISITDHNTMSHHAEIDQLAGRLNGLLILRGEEVTTYGGHANAWGLPSNAWLDFRVFPGDQARMSRIVAQAHHEGALISINHPFALCGGCGWSYDRSAPGFDAIEVWNGAWDDQDEKSLRWWDDLLQHGRRITAIGSSDSHRRTDQLALPTTHVAARALTESDLLWAIRDGHVYVTGEVALPVITFEAEAVTRKQSARRSMGEEVQLGSPGRVRLFIAATGAPLDATIVLISNGQTVRRLAPARDNTPEVVELDGDAGSYFRVEVRASDGIMLALTNPLYVRINSQSNGLTSKR